MWGRACSAREVARVRVCVRVRVRVCVRVRVRVTVRVCVRVRVRVTVRVSAGARAHQPERPRQARDGGVGEGEEREGGDERGGEVGAGHAQHAEEHERDGGVARRC
eukprot:6200213-Pleurochrysis_carterae.AAC.4